MQCLILYLLETLQQLTVPQTWILRCSNIPGIIEAVPKWWRNLVNNDYLSWLESTGWSFHILWQAESFSRFNDLKFTNGLCAIITPSTWRVAPLKEATFPVSMFNALFFFFIGTMRSTSLRLKYIACNEVSGKTTPWSTETPSAKKHAIWRQISSWRLICAFQLQDWNVSTEET